MPDTEHWALLIAWLSAQHWAIMILNMMHSIVPYWYEAQNWTTDACTDHEIDEWCTALSHIGTWRTCSTEPYWCMTHSIESCYWCMMHSIYTAMSHTDAWCTCSTKPHWYMLQTVEAAWCLFKAKCRCSLTHFADCRGSMMHAANCRNSLTHSSRCMVLLQR